MRAPTPTMMRITDGCEVKEDDSVVKSRAFHLMVEEARAALDVFTDIYPSL